MKNFKKTTRALALVLVLVMLVSSIAIFPASAVDIEEEKRPDFLWELDFNKMKDITDNGGSED